MPKRVTTAEVQLWGESVGAVAWDETLSLARFEFEPAFLEQGLDIAPLELPLASAQRTQSIYSFPELARNTFHGLPALLADSLPDKFGNALIDAWLARNGIASQDFSPVERLCYTGRRGIGALEYLPPLERRAQERSTPVEIAELVNLAQQVTLNRQALRTQVKGKPAQDKDALLDILRVGTSAGGARPKAVIAMNDAGDIRSGQLVAPAGYSHWLLKFDGVDDLELGTPRGYGRIEYAYSRMAAAASIDINPCRLLEENDRAHFMTQRFDRPDNQQKLHMLSLCGMAQYDFNLAGAYSYEQAFGVIRKLRLPYPDWEQQYRRMLFNVLARNQDDHTKNIAFLMNEAGNWQLSPAYDLTYAHNPSGRWTNQHQMSIGGKRDNFTRAELLHLGEQNGIAKHDEIYDEVFAAIEKWPNFAADAGLEKARIEEIAKAHRLNLPAV